MILGELGDSSFDESYTDFVPQPHAFRRDACAAEPHRNGQAGGGVDMEELVRTITDQVMAVLNGVAV